MVCVRVPTFAIKPEVRRQETVSLLFNPKGPILPVSFRGLYAA